jgi:DNA-binding CsgD family transcriptional regulator
MDPFSTAPLDAPEPPGEDRLLTAVVAFLGDGLRSGEPGIAIATDAQLAALARRLAAASIDVGHQRQAGQLTFVDTHHMLNLIIVGEEPDADRFTEHVGTIIGEVIRRTGAPLVRVYSGMVDSLSRWGRTEAATQLERLFYGLARTHAFSLLCAHAMSGFYQDADSPRSHPEDVDVDEPGRHDAKVGIYRKITDREADVLRRTALGHSNKDIAHALSISVRTVEAHKANAMRKLGFAERADMIRFAMSKRWLTMAPEEPG